ncbi:MAG: NifB/NifX family molybdenum-iron cluster-binding protein [Deltaproteobacteria bacterium]|nr:NifB/NifX family molybdenum-iron cluster-binding protein [Deltaproteobacteria bacterium]
MKIAISSDGTTLDSYVDPRFGRCPYFLIVDLETLNAEAIENPNVSLGSGAGIQTGQLISKHGAQCLLTGNCGPNAFRVLDAAEIQVVTGVKGNIREVIDQFKAGKYTLAKQPNVESHYGMNKVATDSSAAGNTIGMDADRGQTGGGMGGGRGGVGGGRGGMGGGRGGGMGGGRGGMGGGRGGGMGGGRGGMGGGRCGN